MPPKEQSLSQAEIWDDSALLQSWSDALAEYKLYHSIHARGENVEDTIKAADVRLHDEDLDLLGELETSHSMHINAIKRENLEDGELEEESGRLGESDSFQAAAEVSKVEDSHPEQSMPAVVIGGEQDEALRNVMMSWYYAGYYTGFYQGQQQAKHTALK
ncbi:hypothetical protein MMC21_008323 [Puttea exsequens]|nr:hypothetical protein [Puttea exsequens]